MKSLHCPACGTPFVRVTSGHSRVEELLTRLNFFSFRCQLCTNQFRAFRPRTRDASQAFDRRQYKRLSTNFPAMSVVGAPLGEELVTDISMGGCTLRTSSVLPRGTFFELHLKPSKREEAIKVETAMVCSVRSSSMGIKFLELAPDDKQRLSQMILGLLINQSVSPTM